jgi:hypothetical protein
LGNFQSSVRQSVFAGSYFFPFYNSSLDSIKI